MVPHTISDSPRRSVAEEKVNLRRPWANKGPAMPGEAVRSQKAKGRETAEWSKPMAWI